MSGPTSTARPALSSASQPERLENVSLINDLDLSAIDCLIGPQAVGRDLSRARARLSLRRF